MKPTVEVVKPEVKVEINHKISQQDVIELIAHKQIKKLEAQITEYKDEIEKVYEKLKKEETKFKEEVLKEVTKILNPFLSIIKGDYKIRVTSISSEKIDIEIYSNSEYSKTFILEVAKLATKKSKTHLELEEKNKDLNRKVEASFKEKNEILNNKNSIKNAITEQLLLESDAGKTLLNLVEKAYEQAFPNQKLLK